jgi:hypothetical protein
VGWPAEIDLSSRKTIMTDHATVSLINDVFVARLGDARRIKHADLDEVA